MTIFSKHVGEAWPLWPSLATPMALGHYIRNSA